MKRNQAIKLIYLRFCLLLAVWTATRMIIRLVETRVPIGLGTDLMETVFKVLIMGGLGMLWLRDTPGSDLWRTRRQLYNRHFPAVFWWLLLLMIAYLGITMVAQYHAVHLIAHPLASGDFVSSVLTAGLMEEFLMRGFFMNALLAHYGWVKANVIQAVLFQMTHFPLYFLEGLSVMGWVANITSVLPLGFLFGWLFYHSKNLWPGTILHCVWDTGVTLFL